MNESKPTKFEDGRIVEGDYDNLTVLALAIACRDSSWDFVSFVEGALQLGHLFDNDPTMYPTHKDVLIIANAIDINPADRDKFLADFPLDWDT